MYVIYDKIVIDVIDEEGHCRTKADKKQIASFSFLQFRQK